MSIVFSYGTLLRGMQRSRVLRHARFLGLGEAEGVLLNLIHYPGLIKGSGRVTGELYEVDQDTLNELDQIEGYDPRDAEGSLYQRITLKISSLDDGKHLNAFAYLYNQDTSVFSRISSGDYRQLVEIFTNEETFYIAYGSNRNPDRLKQRIGPIAVGAKGYLDDFRLVFNKANGDGSACANLQSAQGHRVPFVAYRLPEGLDQLYLLDVFEGVPDSYRRIVFPFPLGPDRGHALGHLYVTNPSRISEGLLPKDDYLDHIETGYKIHGFEDDLPRLLGCYEDAHEFV